MESSNQLRNSARTGGLGLDEDDLWKFLTAHRILEVADEVLAQSPVPPSGFDERLDKYFGALQPNGRRTALYQAIAKGPRERACDVALGVLIRNRLFDPLATLDLLNSPEQHKRWGAVQAFRARQQWYRPEDVSVYETLAQVLETAEFAAASTRAKIRKLLSAKEVWTCSRCDNDEAEGIRCQKCGADRQGFRESDLTPQQARDSAVVRAKIIATALAERQARMRRDPPTPSLLPP